MDRIIEIRECSTLEELGECVDLQRAVFALPEIEISPVRHFVVTKNAGGFILGAYHENRLVGFVLSVPAFLRGEKAFYSHMTAVHGDFQSYGIGGRLKWAQRDRALEAEVRYVKWTFEPWKARNAYFNLEKLGAEMREYERNFYGIDYTTAAQSSGSIGLASDRLFAEWDLTSEKVTALAAGEKFIEARTPAAQISVPNDWYELVAADPQEALNVQARLRSEFEAAFADGLAARGFARGDDPRYLLY
jgi:predicted GNAT superfamily acetyltransferase